MSLLAHRVRFTHPRDEGRVDVSETLEPKRMQVIAWRERLDLSKSWMLETPRENHVPIEPSFARRHLRERHPYLERDARLLGENDHRPDSSHRVGDAIEELAHDRLATGKVMVEVVQIGAGVRLIPIGESTTAPRARPERLVRHR